MPSMTASPAVRIGDWIARPALNLLERGPDSIKIGSRAMETLIHFAHHPDEVLSADELIVSVWDGVVVSPNTVYHVINQLREALGDQREQPRYIETIPRRGYRLVADVEFLASPGAATGATEAHGLRRFFGTRTLRWVIPALVGAAVLAGLMALDRSPSERGAIAVMPFDDLSADGAYGWFADSVSEEILGLLDQLPGLTVISRASSFSLRDSELTLSAIAERLEATHVLDGTVRRVGNDIEVTVRLNDAVADRQIWMKQYGGTVGETSAIQEKIAAELAQALKVSLLGVAPAVEYRTSPALYALYDEAVYSFSNLLGDNWGRAEKLLLQVIAADPNYLPAYLALERLYRETPNVGLYTREEANRRADAIREQASVKFPDDLDAQGADPFAKFSAGDFEAAARDYERVLETRTDRYLIGAVPFLVALRRPELAVRVAEFVHRRLPTNTLALANLAHAYLAAGRYDDVEQTYARTSRLARVTPRSNNNLRAAYSAALLLNGKPEAALAELGALTLADAEVFVLTWSSMAYHDLGQETEFEQALERLENLTRDGDRLNVAAVQAHTGNLDAAFRLLFEDIERDTFRIRPVIRFSYAHAFDMPPLDALREDSRWSAFADAAGITAYEQRRQSVSFPVRNLGP
jgi:TolB-like protein/DNA-binding winged helix-turn-helix (wHTH) protein